MILIQGEIPREITVACSGGVDSMAIVDFLSRNHDVSILFVHHGTDTSDQAHKAISRFNDTIETPFMFYSAEIETEIPKGVSQEEHWRNERYKIFHAWEKPIITCHHIDDCVETWVWSSMHGTGKIIPYRNKNVIRPFRLTKKSTFVNWAKNHSISWSEDSSNADTKYTRNYIRHEMMPHVLRVNPGIQKTIAKKVRKDFENG